MERLKRLAKLSPSDALLLLEIGGLLVGVYLGLRLFRFKTFQTFLTRRRGSLRARPHPDPRPLHRLVWAVQVTGRSPFGTCLTEALTLQCLLARRGLATRLWLGVRPGQAPSGPRGNPLLAHAWLEHDGRPILGGAVADGYAPLAYFDGGPTVTRTVSA